MSDTKEVLALLGWAVRHSWDDHHNEDGDGIRALVQRARNQHDAERATIAALKADLARHKRALAAGPAALRDGIERARAESEGWLDDDPPDTWRAADAQKRANTLHGAPADGVWLTRETVAACDALACQVINAEGDVVDAKDVACAEAVRGLLRKARGGGA